MFVKTLARLVPGRLWLAAAVVAIGAGGWLWHQVETSRLAADAERLAGELSETRAEAERLRDQRNQWEARAEQQGRDLARVQQERARSELAVRELQEALADRDERYRELQVRIRRAPAAADGPVAPVLRDTLEALP